MEYLEKRKQLLFFGILVVGFIGIGAASPTIYAIVEPHITINMDPGQTTKPFQINDNLGTEIFSVDTDGTIFPSDGSGAGLTFASVVKSVDETITNSITFQDDDQLRFVARENKTYGFMLTVFVTSPSGAGFQTQWTLPAGATGSISSGQLNSGVTQSTQDITTTNNHLISGTSLKVLTFVGKIKTSTTSGESIFQWTPSSLNLGNTIVEQGSYLRVWEVVEA